MHCFLQTWHCCILAFNMEAQKVYLFDVATCEYFSLDIASFEVFMEKQLVELDSEITHDDYFEESMQFLKLTELKSDDCLAHKIPLFLGGEDDAKNFQKISCEVAWDMHVQLAEGINKG